MGKKNPNSDSGPTTSASRSQSVYTAPLSQQLRCVPPPLRSLTAPLSSTWSSAARVLRLSLLPIALIRQLENFQTENDDLLGLARNGCGDDERTALKKSSLARISLHPPPTPQSTFLAFSARSPDHMGACT